jgi:hypothetical protein
MGPAAYQTRLLPGDAGGPAADVLLVRPAAFGPNAATAASNAFQRAWRGPPSGLQRRVLAEFRAVVVALRRAGVRAHVFQDTPSPRRPDAIFPNNWVSFHADGTAILYPLAAANRRPERRTEFLAALGDRGFRIRRVVDLAPLEDRGWFLEGTGSLVLDRARRQAFAALSPRTHPAALARFAAATGYRVHAFPTRGPGGRPVYHTNVLLALGQGFAVVAAGVIPGAHRRAVLGALAAGGREVIRLDAAQLGAFAGNVLELAGRQGPCIALSARAAAALGPTLRRRLARHGELVPVPIPTIERVGGGGLRCLLAELYLPGGG